MSKAYDADAGLDKRLPFIRATYAMTNSLAHKEGVGWTEDGKGIEVRNVSYFCEHVLPHFFKHGNLSSFVRQLNMYGFEKDECRRPGVSHVFVHPVFRRGCEDKLDTIKRKTVKNRPYGEGEHEDAIHAAEDIEKLTAQQADLEQRLRALEERNGHLVEQNQKLRAAMEHLDVAQGDILEQMRKILLFLYRAYEPADNKLDGLSASAASSSAGPSPRISFMPPALPPPVVRGERLAALDNVAAADDDDRIKRLRSTESPRKAQLEDSLRKLDSFDTSMFRLPANDDLVRAHTFSSTNEPLNRMNSLMSNALFKQGSLSQLLDDVVLPSKESLPKGGSSGDNKDGEYRQVTQSLADHIDKTGDVFRRLDTLSSVFNDE